MTDAEEQAAAAEAAVEEMAWEDGLRERLLRAASRPLWGRGTGGGCNGGDGEEGGRADEEGSWAEAASAMAPLLQSLSLSSGAVTPAAANQSSSASAWPRTPTPPVPVPTSPISMQQQQQTQAGWGDTGGEATAAAAQRGCSWDEVAEPPSAALAAAASALLPTGGTPTPAPMPAAAAADPREFSRISGGGGAKERLPAPFDPSSPPPQAPALTTATSVAEGLPSHISIFGAEELTEGGAAALAAAAAANAREEEALSRRGSGSSGGSGGGGSGRGRSGSDTGGVGGSGPGGLSAAFAGGGGTPGPSRLGPNRPPSSSPAVRSHALPDVAADISSPAPPVLGGGGGGSGNLTPGAERVRARRRTADDGAGGGAARRRGGGFRGRGSDSDDEERTNGDGIGPGSPAAALGAIAAHRVPAAQVKVERVIGEGAFGAVSLACCPTFGRVAVKWLKQGRRKLRKDQEGDRGANHRNNNAPDAAAASFWREAATLSGLNHPNVLRFYGVVVADGTEIAADGKSKSKSGANSSSTPSSASAALPSPALLSTSPPPSPPPCGTVVGIMTEFMAGGSLGARLRSGNYREQAAAEESNANGNGNASDCDSDDNGDAAFDGGASSADGGARRRREAAAASQRPRCPPLPLRTRAELALGAVSGLAYLHEMRVVHFDLKPDNLLLDGPLVLPGEGGGGARGLGRRRRGRATAAAAHWLRRRAPLPLRRSLPLRPPLLPSLPLLPLPFRPLRPLPPSSPL
jgi:hypothetical protein